MQHLKEYLEKNRQMIGLPAGELLIELYAPQRVSRLNRCLYLVKIDTNASYSLIIQTDRSLAGHPCRTNPYEPGFHEGVSNLLVGRRGAFQLGNSRYYWSRLIAGPSLLDTMRADLVGTGGAQLLAVAQKVLESQCAAAKPAQGTIEPLLSLVTEKIDEPRLAAAFTGQAAIIRDLVESLPQGVASWSHGDLWPKEVFITESGCSIIDWEWALPEAPLGADIIDLYLNSAQHVLNASLENSWHGLLTNNFQPLQRIHDLLSTTLLRFDPELRSLPATLLYCLLRWWGREVAQDGAVTLNNGRTFLQLAKTIAEGEYSFRWKETSPDRQEITPGISVKVISSDILFSVIMPTFNRGDFLAKAIESIAVQGVSHRYYEILVVDNGSTDSTQDVVQQMAEKFGKETVRYLYEPVPGLLSGRHRGALEARGDFLTFVDDDIIAAPGWLAAIIDSFTDHAVHVVGGPSLPMFEAQPPHWVAPYCSLIDNHLTCGYLSLLDLGGGAREIDPIYVWGLNYSIRKATLFELGGFHPDNIPKQFQCFQGDGETGLSRKISERGYKAFYHPEAQVSHRIPADRLTVEAFKQRQFYQGVCDSFTVIRLAGSAEQLQFKRFDPENQLIPRQPEYQEIHQAIHKAYVDGHNFHLEAVKRSAVLLAWVLKPDYFDYALPELAQQ